MVSALESLGLWDKMLMKCSTLKKQSILHIVLRPLKNCLSCFVSKVAPLSEGVEWFHRLHDREPGLVKVVLTP